MTPNATSNSLSYQPLRHANNEIRILIIEPSRDPNQPIACRLKHVPLANSSDYVALSYCWGQSNKTERAIVNGKTTHITPSLAAALKTLRDRNYKRVWADALCINQADKEERSRQVPRMAAIYRHARTVIARPGDASDKDAHALLGLISDLQTLSKSNKNYNQLESQDTPNGRAVRSRNLREAVNQVNSLIDKYPKSPRRGLREKLQEACRLAENNLRNPQWQVFTRLLRCEYWSRVWIIQELAMATRLKIIWGSQSLNLNDIAFLVEAFNMLRDVKWISNVVPFEACLHVQNLVKFQSMQKQLSKVSLIRALGMTSFARATDARDKVYSLIGLTYDGDIIFPIPSYTPKLIDINREATLRIVQITDSLDHVMCRSTPPGSWVIDWFNPKTWSDPRIVTYLAGQASFRTESGRPTTWQTSGTTCPRIKLWSGGFQVHGTIIDTIRDCSATYSERESNSVPASRPQKATLDKDSARQIYQCFYLASKDGEHLFHENNFFAEVSQALATEPSSDKSKAILRWITCSLNSSLMIGGRSLREWFTPSRRSRFEMIWKRGKQGQRAHDSIALVVRCLKMGMSLGETIKGRIGWFNQYALPGDKIAIISGCTVPVVLRTLPKKQGYTIVGDGIIPCIMEGEKEGKLNKESFLYLT
ncbi:heterokaryon incompatibility protein-domain-containing protein [Fusarium tricinctum]|uniref:Heterokaryon incompatibility protein-domain-containing protein n=1 Tax=Fusarium tricinctum TaxID=61284 RepID=A0A8K0W5A5_9HYPO|nr:heterokaryon incompatibility protein-domain-containing protein [Fusarium tricinctum]